MTMPLFQAKLFRVAFFLAFLIFSMASLARAEHVILIHGLARSPKSMQPMERGLQAAGYQTLNLHYPSRSKTVRALADEHLGLAIAACRKKGPGSIHFVTHSLGGILVRDYLARHDVPELGRVVMLAPPNKGSEVVDRIGHWRSFKAVNGPAGRELSTDEAGVPKTLGPVTYAVGIIAGDRSINWINSRMIPGPDDGKVSVENTKLEGMTDHVVVHRTHPMIMKRSEVIELTLRFLEAGSFKP